MLPTKVIVPPDVTTFKEHIAFWEREANGMMAEYNGWRDVALQNPPRTYFVDDYTRGRYEQGYTNATAKLNEERHASGLRQDA